MISSLTISALLVIGPSVHAPDFRADGRRDPDPATVAPAAAGQGGGGAAGQRGAATGAGGRGAGPAAGGRGGRGDMGSGWGSTITVTQAATSLTVQYAFFGRGDMQPPLKFVYALDGSESKNTVMMGRGMQVQTAKTAWDGERLVITTLHSLADPATGKPTTSEVKQVLSLESPTSLVVETTRAGVMGGPATTTKTVYRKIQ